MQNIMEFLRARKLRIIMSLVGVVICAVSVGVFKIAALGVDPFQSLMSGLDSVIPIKFGTLYVIVNIILLLFSILADRHNIGIATFINLFLLGYITQFTYDFLQRIFPDPSTPFRVVCLIIGIVVIILCLFLVPMSISKVYALKEEIDNADIFKLRDRQRQNKQ